MKNCDTCKWWGEEEYGGRTIHRKCNNRFVGIKRRGLPVMLEADMLAVEESAAFPVSAEAASFYTGPKFGCIHWERKE